MTQVKGQEKIGNPGNPGSLLGKSTIPDKLRTKLLENKEFRQKDRKSKFFKPAPEGSYKLQIYDVVGRVKRDIKDANGNVTKTIYPYRYKIVDHNNLGAGILIYDAPSTVSESIDMGLENGMNAFVLTRKGATQMNTKYTVMGLPKDQELDLDSLNLKDETETEKDTSAGNGEAGEVA